MRPILALIMVVVAVATLFFAFQVGSSDDDKPSGLEVEQAATQVQENDGGPATLTDAPGSERGTVDIASAPLQDEERATASDFENQLTGLVQNMNREPVADATVILSTFSFQGFFFADDDGQTGEQWETTSDANGRYVFKDVEPRNGYSLTARHADYSPAEISDVNVGTTGIYEEPPIVLHEGARLTGTVRDTAGNVVSGAIMNLDSAIMFSADKPSPDRLTVETDSAGQYVFSNVPKRGMRNLEVTAAGYGTLILSGLNFDETDNLTKDVVLQVAEMIAGQVVGPSQENVVGATVMALTYRSSNKTTRTQVRTDENGQFLLEDLPPGSYTILVNGPGYRPERVQRVETGKLDLVIRVSTLPTVQGRVVDSMTGRAVTAFTCRLREVIPNAKATSPTTEPKGVEDEKGQFTIGCPKAGSFVVEAMAPGFAASFSESFTVIDGQTLPGITVRMTQGGTIRGRVINADKVPVARAMIQTHASDWTDDAFTRMLGDAYPTNATSAKVRTKRDGTFVISGLTPAQYMLDIQLRGYTNFSLRDVNVTEGGDLDVGDLLLSRGGSVVGTVYDQAGNAMMGARVQLRPLPEPGTFPQTYSAKSGKDGRYEVANVRPGSYRISVSRTSSMDANIFEQMADVKSTEGKVRVVENEEYVYDLTLGARR
ncbi:MAG: carboxypeptidase-like regulatory domain-containing protein [Planctomycetota bacterium]|nr:carboxypeptidase-like regulatory domain-containing protein [Planctomycetota bacterium]